MAYQSLREAVYEANMELDRRGLVLYTFGNASGIDREKGIVAIKPSGVAYADLRPEHLVLVDLENRIVEGTLRPSSDTPTHTLLYKTFPSLGGIVHTHSTFATAWCQARRDLPCYGTTHADYAYGTIPCTAMMTDAQLARDYTTETGMQIVEAFRTRNLDPLAVPMVLVAGHAPFTWGTSPEQAAYHAVILEELARMAVLTLQISPDTPLLPQSILDIHYRRKHGPSATYGQTTKMH